MLFLRNNGADCGANARPFLTSAPGSSDLGCGYIGGGPFGEAFGAAGVDTAKVYATTSPFDVTVDARRSITGTITVVPYVQGPSGTGTGVGQIVVDLVAAGEIPFAIDVADEADRLRLDQFSLSVTIRGVHAAHGFNELNGASFVKVPFHRTAPAE